MPVMTSTRGYSSKEVVTTTTRYSEEVEEEAEKDIKPIVAAVSVLFLLSVAAGKVLHNKMKNRVSTTNNKTHFESSPNSTKTNSNTNLFENNDNHHDTPPSSIINGSEYLLPTEEDDTTTKASVSFDNENIQDLRENCISKLQNTPVLDKNVNENLSKNELNENDTSPLGKSFNLSDIDEGLEKTENQEVEAR